jgi:SAM-dependent methyltransferase
VSDLSEQQLIELAHSELVFNAPLSSARADDLVRRLDVGPSSAVLDVGCGDGEMLLRLCAQGGHGVGVDVSAGAVARAAQQATGRGVADRVRFVTADARTWTQDADVVCCVGAAHVWGGAAGTLAALRSLTRPGGRLLFGDGFWEQEPSDPARQIFGDLLDLPALVEAAVGAGWRPLFVGTSVLDEFDAWESDWRAGLERSGHPQALALADQRRDEYLRVYRGVLGFAWLVLMPARQL